jgi:hypothetical protein
MQMTWSQSSFRGEKPAEIPGESSEGQNLTNQRPWHLLIESLQAPKDRSVSLNEQFSLIRKGGGRDDWSNIK